MIATSPPKAPRSKETNKNLDAVVKVLKEEQKRTGIKLLWGTACLFAHPRFAHGAATSCNADVFAYAGGAGEEGPGSDPRLWAALVTSSGAAAKVTPRSITPT